MSQTYTEVMRLVLDGGQEAARELQMVTRAADSATSEFKDTQRAATDTSKSFSQLSTSLGRSVSAFGAVTGAVQVLGKAMSGLGSVANTALGGVSKVMGGIGGMARGATNVLATGFTAAAGAVGAFGVHSFQAAARVGTLDASLRALGKTNGLSKETIDEQVNSIRKMGIEYGTAQEVMAKFIQNQLDTTKASQLARVAQDAAVIGNINSSEALDRLIHGITTQQTDVLRGVGINIDAQRAMDKYAKSLGVTTKQLTASQKQQAMMNAVLDAGKNIAGAYEESLTTAGKIMNSYKRVVDDLAVAFGKQLVPAMEPLLLHVYDLIKALGDTETAGAPLNMLFQLLGKALGAVTGPLDKVVVGVTNFMKSLKPEQIKKWADQLARLKPLLAPILGAFLAIGSSNIAGMLGPLGMLLPKINPILGVIAGLIVSMPQLRSALGKVLGVIGDLARALGTAFTSDAGALGVVGDLIEKVFGKGVADTIRKFVLQPLMDFLRTVQAAGGWTEYLKGKFEEIRPTIQRVGEIITTMVLPAIANLANWIRNSLIPALSDLWQWLQANVLPVIVQVASWVRDVLLPAFMQLATWVMQTLVPALAELWQWLAANIIPVVQQVATWVLQTLLPAIQLLATWIIQNLVPAVELIVGWLAQNLVPAIMQVAGWLLEHLLPLIIALASWILKLVPPIVDLVGWLWERLAPAIKFLGEVLAPVLDLLTRLFTYLSENTPVLNVLKEVFSAIGNEIDREIALIGSAIEWWGKFFDKVGTVLHEVLEPMKGVLEAIKGFLENMPSLPDWKLPEMPGLPTPGMPPALAPAPVPVGIADNGGLLPSGSAALNLSGKPEFVLPPGAQMPPIAPGGVGTGAPVVSVTFGSLVVNTRATATPAFVDEVARMLAPALERELGNMVVQ